MKTRIISAVVLVAAAMIMIYALPSIVTAVVVGLALAVAAFELLYKTGLVRHPRLVIYSAVAAFLVPIWCWAGRDHAWGMLLVIVFFVALFAEMMSSHIRLTFDKIGMCFAAGLIIPYLLSSVVRILILPRVGRYFILLPILMAVLPDTGGYFGGKFFGRHKLAPVISPKKTVEGVVGGVIMCMLGMLIYGLVLKFAFDMQVNFGYALLYGLVGSFGSVFGDLSFSVIKRQTGIKDYGNLIPGHGGILDRFDSWTVVAPLCEIMLLLIPIAVK